MSDDVFDLGESADEPDENDSATTGDSSNTGNSATSASNAGTSNNASNSSDDGSSDTELDPTRSSAYDTDYQSIQRTIGVRDETWQEVTDLLEDAEAYSNLDGYRDITKLESYEALFQHVLDTSDSKEIASRIQTARHEAHDTT